MRVIFHPCAALTPKPLVTPWCMLGPMVDVITHALFQPVQGLGSYGNPHIPDFLYLAIMTLTTVSTTVLSAINVKETSVEV